MAFGRRQGDDQLGDVAKEEEHSGPHRHDPRLDKRSACCGEEAEGWTGDQTLIPRMWLICLCIYIYIFICVCMYVNVYECV